MFCKDVKDFMNSMFVLSHEKLDFLTSTDYESPGSLGTLDFTHIPWHQCSFELIESFAGRKKTPTRIIEAA